MSGCVYRTADNQCQKYSDPIRNTMSWCVGNEPCEGRTPSNADRIRAMSDEKLAEFIVKIKYPYRGDGKDYEIAINWLKSPVEVDNGT